MKKRLVHGGDWEGFQEEYGREPLDFSANVSPLGVPSGVKMAIAKAAGEVDKYPDPLCRKLRAAIGQHHGIDPSLVLPGNGGADLIFRTVQAVQPAKAMVTAPAFAEYREALEACGAGCEVIDYLLPEKTGFAVEQGFLEALRREKPDLVFLCEPNNPTGRTTEKTLLLQIMEQCREDGVVLFLDESFNEFLAEGQDQSMVSRLGEFPNVVILQAFTKIYGMAGVRLGYLMSANQGLLGKIRRCGQPWGVSLLAQEAGIAALEDSEYPKNVRQLIQSERPFVEEILRGFGFQVMPGEANYVLFRGPEDLADRLETQGILIRRCDNYRGLGPGWFRTAVRTHSENERLLMGLQEVCHE